MADIVNLEAHYIGSPEIGVNLYEIPNATMQVMQDLINATWNQALLKSAELEAALADAKATFLDITNPPTVSAGQITAVTASDPGVTIPSVATVDDVFDKFTQEYLELATWLDAQFTDVITTYFPTEQATYATAEAALKGMLDNPNAGIPAAVLAQVLGDDQARALADKTRAQDAVFAQFAGRGFPLPPAVAASVVLQIEQKAQDAVAESSRKVAVMSIENMKFAIEKALNLHKDAMQSAVDYVKALASGPDMASRLVNVGYDAQSKLISSASSYFQARISAADMVNKVNQYNNSTAFEVETKNQASELAMIENKLRGLLSHMQTIGQTCAAFANNLNVSAGLKADGGTTVSSSGSF